VLVDCLDFKKSTSGAKGEVVLAGRVDGVFEEPADVEECTGGLQ